MDARHQYVLSIMDSKKLTKKAYDSYGRGNNQSKIFCLALLIRRYLKTSFNSVVTLALGLVRMLVSS
jgi:hypothetical protein